MRRIVQSAAVVMLIRCAGAALAYATQVLLARWMGAFEFGIYAYCWVLVSVLVMLAPLGLTSAIARFVAEYRVQEDWDRLAGVVRSSHAVTFTCGTAWAAFCALVVAVNHERIPEYYLVPFYLALACLPFFGLLQLVSETVRTFGWMTLAFAPLYIARPILLLVTGLTIVAIHDALTASAMLMVALMSCILVLVPQAIAFLRRLPSAIRNATPRYQTTHWIRIAFPMLLAHAFYFLLTYTDVVMLGGFVLPTEIGIYNAAARTAGLLSFVTYAVSALATVKFSALHTLGKQDELRAIAIDVAHWVFWPTLILGVGLVAAGRIVLGLFGAEFTAGYHPLLLLVMGYVVGASNGGVGNLLNMTGHQDATAKALGIAAGLNVVLNLVLIRHYGIEGAATATAISLAVLVILLTWVARRRLGFYVLIFARRRDAGV